MSLWVSNQVKLTFEHNDALTNIFHYEKSTNWSFSPFSLFFLLKVHDKTSGGCSGSFFINTLNKYLSDNLLSLSTQAAKLVQTYQNKWDIINQYVKWDQS